MLPSYNIPPIGPKQAKVWGDTQLLFVFNGVECHRIRFDEKGYCSCHRHRHKWNRFVVLKGRLLVDVFRGDEPNEETADRTEIGPGQATDVPPGVLHRFTGLESGEALEFYWTSLEVGDIERIDVGGVL